MSTIKRLSPTKISNVVNMLLLRPQNVTWHGHEISVRPVISANEYMTLIHNVLSECTTEDDNVAIEMLDCAIKAHIIMTYASVDLPEDFQELFNAVYASGLYETVCSVASKTQIDAIYESVKLYLEG